MKDTKITIRLYAGIFIMMLIAGQAFGQQQKLQWNTFNDGITKAKVSGKKILIDVYTDWCSWCKKMDANTYSDSKVQEYLKKHFVVIKLNAEADQPISYSGEKMSPMDFSRGMGVNGYPATLFLMNSGKPITILPGYSEPAMFLHVLSYIAEDQFVKKNFDQYLNEKGVKF